MIDKLSNGLKSFAVVVFTILLTVLLLPISGNVSSVYALTVANPMILIFLASLPGIATLSVIVRAM